MEVPNVFSPDLGDVYLTMGICAALFFGLIFLAVRLGKLDNPDPRKKVLLPMLAYFLSLLALMGFLGGFWSLFKYPTVEITGRNLIINDEAHVLPGRHEMRLDAYEGSGSSQGTRILFVQTKDRKTWAFPEDRYPITEMLRLLRGAE